MEIDKRAFNAAIDVLAGEFPPESGITIEVLKWLCTAYEAAKTVQPVDCADYKTAYDLSRAASDGFKKLYEDLQKKYHALKEECYGLHEGIEQLRAPEREVVEVNHYEMAIATDFPDGTSLYVKENGVGGHTYYTDEIGCAVIVWDTALVSEKALLAAIEHNKGKDIEDEEPNV